MTRQQLFGRKSDRPGLSNRSLSSRQARRSRRLQLEPLEQRYLLSVASATDADYLIICANQFCDEVQPLAEWKHMKGFKTYVAPMSEVGTTHDDVYDYISNAYNNGPQTSYVLLVGDNEGNTAWDHVPGYEFDGAADATYELNRTYYPADADQVWHTDYPYACITPDINDLQPELAVGRLSADTEDQATTMIEKVMAYDRTPDPGDWYDDALLASYFEATVADNNTADNMFMETTHRLADFLGGDFDYWGNPDPNDQGYDVNTDALLANFALNANDYHYNTTFAYAGYVAPPDPVPAVWRNSWTDNEPTATAAITTAIDGGVGLTIHRDHGYLGGGGWGAPNYQDTHVNALSNDTELPVVLSFNCSSGRYDGVDDFAEAWHRNPNGGAVSYMGPARTTDSVVNELLMVGHIDAFWDDCDPTWTSATYPTTWRPAEALNRTKVQTLQGFASTSRKDTSEQSVRMYNYFGDPEIMLRTETPVQLEAAYQHTVLVGQATNLTVTVTASGIPVDGATVCISNGDSTDYWVGTTNAAGEVTFNNLTTTEWGKYDVVAWAHDADPFEGTLNSLGRDVFERNDSIETATVLGSLPEVTLQRLSIHSTSDVDYFRYAAHDTGKLLVTAYRTYEDGPIEITLLDRQGNTIAERNIISANPQILVPVVSGETYYVKVLGKDCATNIYDLEIENFPAPIPSGGDLALWSDSGRNDEDHVTNVTQPQLFIQADLLNFVDTDHDGTANDEITVLSATQANAGNTPGAAVEVYVTNMVTGTVVQGYADPVSATEPTLFRFWPNTDLQDGIHLVTASVRIFDNQQDSDQNSDPEDGRTMFSEKLFEFTVDTVLPFVDFGHTLVIGDGLDPASDSGVLGPGNAATFADRITNDTTPAFFGFGESNAIVQAWLDVNGNSVIDWATDRPLGETVAVPLDGNVYEFGYWDLTSMLDMNDPSVVAAIDGPRRILIAAEDLAGNVAGGVSVTKAVSPALAIPDTGQAASNLSIWDMVGTIVDLNVTLNITHPYDGDLTVSLTAPDGTTTVTLFSNVGGSGDNFSWTTLDDEGWNVIDDPANTAPFGGFFQLQGGALLSTFDGLDPNGTWTLTVQDGAGGDVGTLDNWSLTIETTNKFLDIFIDTQGPQVTAVKIPDDPTTAYDESTYDLFNPKTTPGGHRPTPQMTSLDIDVRDLPNRVTDFLYDALVSGDPTLDPGNYLLQGDANGIIPIDTVTFNPVPPVNGQPATGTITLTFFEPLPDDRFTLTISDELVDPVGNKLDGETNTVEPQETPRFPSGDGIPGGDFVARFTVDSRPEIGTWSAGSVYVDTNGNFIFDPANLDHTNRDLVYALGFTSDYVFAGDFAALTDNPGTPNVDERIADGFDKLAAYGLRPGGFGVGRFLVDTTNDGVPDIITDDPAGIIGQPVAGNFDRDDANGDEVGLYDGTGWWLDGLPVGSGVRDFIVGDQSRIVIPGMSGGYPIVGDFDGDGNDDLGTFQGADASGAPTGVFTFALSTGPGTWAPVLTIDFQFQDFIGVRERPVAADMDGDGIDDLGLWVPDRSGATPWEAGEWYFLLSDDLDETKRILGQVNTLDHPFSPHPLGDDLFAQFGDEFAVPIVGNFDPPVAGEGGSAGAALLSLLGTPEDDVLEITAGSTPGAWTVVLNGVAQGEASGGTFTLTFDGLGGNDTFTMIAPGGDDVAELSPGHGTVTGDGYSVAVSNVETVAVDGGGGADLAFLRDNPDGKDTLTAGPDAATFAGDGYSNQVTSFRWVHVFGTAGHADAAMLQGQPGAQDEFEAWPDRAKLAGTDFLVRTNQISYVTVDGQPGDVDVALLHDDPNTADTFEGRPEAATLSGEAFSVRVNSFPYVHAYATAGGDDLALFYDNPDGFDKLRARPGDAKLWGEFFFLHAKSFQYVYANSTPGTGDQALLYDSLTDDTFTAWPDRAELSGDTFFAQVNSFRWVHAYSTAGADAATFHGSDARDVFVANHRMSKLRGDGFYNRAVSFERVEAYGGGGRDVAVLRDAVLESGVTEPLDTLQLAWLYEFERIRQRSDSGQSVVDATDQIFTAYWE